MTQPTPEEHPVVKSTPVPVPADDQPTMRLRPADPDATRPMSLADLLESDS